MILTCFNEFLTVVDVFKSIFHMPNKYQMNNDGIYYTNQCEKSESIAEQRLCFPH